MTDIRFSKIDENNIEDHSFLEESDVCLFLHEYTSGVGYTYSGANSLITNLKKLPSKRHSNPIEFEYKQKAIRDCARRFQNALNPRWLKESALVPVPPSKVRGEPEYDDRMLQVCNQIKSAGPTDVRELVIQRKNIRAAHECDDGERPSVDELVTNYMIDDTCTAPAPKCIGIVDDVITAGSHFKAMQRVLSMHFPGVPIVGIFVARRVFS